MKQFKPGFCKRFLDILKRICYILIKRLMTILKGFSITDLVFLNLWLRISYIAVSQGLLKEISKSIGLFFSTIIAFHYHPVLGKEIESKVPLLGKGYSELVSFILIFVAGLIVLSLLRKVIFAFFKKGDISSQEKWLSFFMGGIRFIFLVSVIIFVFSFLPPRLRYVRDSYLHPVCESIAPKMYLASFKFFNYLCGN